MISKTSNGQIAKMADAKITIIGAGKMARLLLVHLQTQDVKEITIVNRSPGSVDTLKAEFPDLVLHYKELPQMLEVVAESDIVYPSTASMEPIIFADQLKAALAGRTSKGGVQFVDISVPRNVDPACASVAGAFCYNVDDLKAGNPNLAQLNPELSQLNPKLYPSCGEKHREEEKRDGRGRVHPKGGTRQV